MARYRQRRSNPRNRSPQEMQAYINAHLAKNGGRQSLSYLIQCLRDDDYYISTNLNFAEDDLTRLGFVLRRETNEYGSILRTYVHKKD